MKVWCVPISVPHPEKEPEQAEAALKFIRTLKGLTGLCPHNGLVVLTFKEHEDARAAKWKLEEFSNRLEIIEGTTDGKTLNLTKVVKGE